MMFWDFLPHHPHPDQVFVPTPSPEASFISWLETLHSETGITSHQDLFGVTLACKDDSKV